MRPILALLAATFLCGPATAQELSGTLKKIKETNRIVLGVRDSSVPFSYLDDKNGISGFTVDICETIVEAIKAEIKAPDLRVEKQTVISSTRLPLMTNGSIDLECGTTTNNAERQKQVTFTNTHFLAATRFASKVASGLDGIDSLKGRTVATVAGSTNAIQLNRVNGERKLGMTIQSAKDPAEGFLLLETGRVAAMVTDDVQLSILIAQSKEPAAYKVSEEAFSLPEPYGIMLRRDDAPFKALADRATADLYRSPAMTALYAKWFQSPVPPNGLNFRVPLSPELKRVYAEPTSSPDPAAYALP
ncbi:amino acid ABC transporter substrate-binding protein [Methylobacterium oryzihabitans]|uniref:Amino acid ABC transporter substrate-binding protein n=1 Tax=Methylobacterium oryzihabitans TaxID=2499852 RepID=A0A437PBV8_9HYPH|nr:amino acid ABC transporter substrate-binding protein [Methylobacterium oryzihabitans]RVU19748.1 amino acid ABC transporter substrate-binding protein [Methylobacterium oryzihabitans]